MRIVSTTGAKSLEHNGITYEFNEGAFEVPEPVGEELVRFPHWKREYQATPDAASMAERIRALEAQAAGERGPSDAEAALLARVAELEAQIAGHRSDEAKPAAKKTAAKKTAAPHTHPGPSGADGSTGGAGDDAGA